MHVPYAIGNDLSIINTYEPIFQTINDDGLTYIEVTFSNTTSDRRPIIHGAGDKTNYVDIDFTRTAEPLPDDSD